jgi:sugar phosphate isomerase/epimerase
MSPTGAGAMNLRERIGIDVGRKLLLEEAIPWAAANEVRFIDLQLDTGANALGTIDDKRALAVRAACEKHAVRLGLHTASAVNVAEYAPYVGDAVEEYLRAYVDAAVRLGAGWIVMHAGFHFTSDKEQRMQAGRERLKRVIDYAERQAALVLLENLNKEPPAAEVHYLAHTVEEWRFYFEAIQSTACPSPLTTPISCPRGSPALSRRSI